MSSRIATSSRITASSSAAFVLPLFASAGRDMCVGPTNTGYTVPTTAPGRRQTILIESWQHARRRAVHGRGPDAARLADGIGRSAANAARSPDAVAGWQDLQLGGPPEAAARAPRRTTR